MKLVFSQLAGSETAPEWDSVSDLTSSFAKVSYFAVYFSYSTLRTSLVDL